MSMLDVLRALNYVLYIFLYVVFCIGIVLFLVFFKTSEDYFPWSNVRYLYITLVAQFPVGTIKNGRAKHILCWEALGVLKRIH